MCENAGAQQFLCNEELLFATYTDSVTLMGGLQAVAVPLTDLGCE